jgi:acyl carrier protein
MNDRLEIQNKLVEFLDADAGMRVENLTEELSLREGLGLDSVDLVSVIMRVEGHYRIRLSHAELMDVATVGQLLDLIQAKRAANAGGDSSRSQAA